VPSYARGNAPIQKKHTPKKSQLSPDQIRLNKYIANSGICSRRDADIYIASGNVTVNGEVVTEMGYKVELSDVIKFDGRAINPEKKTYILLNKPKGFLTTTSDDKGRKTVMDLVAKATKARIVPVGRLERSTTGLLLFTNDGELSKKLTDKGQEVRKIYQVTLNKSFQVKDLYAVKEGLNLEDGLVKVDEISMIEGGNKNEVGIKIHSNKNKIVRRIFEHLDYEVIKLDRVVFAGLTKKDLPRGTWRHLTKQEVINLQML
jgi:23S rRNA pseudouridine2605 synthase